MLAPTRRRRAAFADVAQVDKRQPSDADRASALSGTGLKKAGVSLLQGAGDRGGQVDSRAQTTGGAGRKSRSLAGRLIDPPVSASTNWRHCPGDLTTSCPSRCAGDTYSPHQNGPSGEGRQSLAPTGWRYRRALLPAPLPDGAEIAAHRETIDAIRVAICARRPTRRVRPAPMAQLAEIEQALEDADAHGPIVIAA